MHWIFLRGLVRETRHWGNFPDIFREAIPQDEICMIDLPGNGTLWASKSPTDVAKMVEHCRTELKRRNINPPVGILAMSLGAMVASDWALRHPEEISKCVLINTSLRPFSPMYHRLRPRNYLRLLRLMLPGSCEEKRQASILHMTSNAALKPNETVAEWAAWQRQHPVSGRNALRQILAAIRYHAPETAPFVQMLILASEGDRLVDCRCSKQLAGIWRTDLAVHPKAGHDLPLDDPNWVTDAVKQWLIKTEGTGE